MSFTLWHRSGDLGVASPRMVLSADEVPVLQRAIALCAQVEQLHSHTHERLAEAARVAAESGRVRGLDEGRRAAGEELAASLLSISQALARERERLRREIGPLALQVVRKLLGHFADDALLAALAETAAQEVLPTQQLVLFVHSTLCDAVRERLGARGAPDAMHIDVRGEDDCARDHCRLETEHGSVEASLESQLQRLADAWAAVLSAEVSK